MQNLSDFTLLNNIGGLTFNNLAKGKNYFHIIKK